MDPADRPIQCNGADLLAMMVETRGIMSALFEVYDSAKHKDATITMEALEAQAPALQAHVKAIWSRLADIGDRNGLPTDL